MCRQLAELRLFKREVEDLAYLVISLVHCSIGYTTCGCSDALFGKGDFAALDEATLESVVAKLLFGWLSRTVGSVD